MNDCIKHFEEIERNKGIKFPPLYKRFLSEKIKDSDTYEIVNNRNENIYLYSHIDIEERNEAYDIQSVEPDYFLIGQDGDVGYFIYVKENDESDVIFSVDLGALGSLSMEVEASDIYALSS
ncbi:TPA: SMI1/KNR4 family protein [Salmonella enterica subsp. enterica serovar Enteritidis]|uniref:SMI1/KNR4 family protein n=1 Tax=Salmonella enterica TaxID=28901 RepID=UPI0002A69C7C|nr:SMI1/KNR4 family protein [Salmonella enterica]EHM3443870.1 SMI1/KNR4 family protein [Salmonella enterica subsp. enterica]ELO81164.1 hypothetical protein SEEERB17_000910 [Salmonella enterica subsp. enterica serovar Enteritidis str. SARB17]EHW9183140.1 SMI1/KNR4 family protein [Salmonella enterica subsp. enterica]EJF5648124.1 SMI1/KNR4 family protein [Salmonella enterica]EJF6002684.1 SMI1/KNR4 family protein [Salmonella enterica]